MPSGGSSQGPRGIARAAAGWMWDIAPGKFESTTGLRNAARSWVFDNNGLAGMYD